MTHKQALRKLEKLYPKDSVLAELDLWRHRNRSGTINCRLYADNGKQNKTGAGETWKEAFMKLEENKFEYYPK